MKKKIMLDAGHGLNTPGKRTLNGDKGIIHEFTLNQAVVNYITKNLADYDVEIKYSHDPSGATDVPLATRVNRTNDYNPDMFISIHHNALNGQWGKHTGTEVYYHTYGTAEDKKVAELLAPLEAKYTKLANRGAKKASFVVLTCKATAILCEGGFMDSTIDYPVITSTEGQKAYALAVSEVIISHLSLKKITPPPTETDTTKKVIYRVIVGSYKGRSNAETQQKALKNAGFETFLAAYKKDNETFYRVIAGSYEKKANAEAQVQKLKQKGFEAFLGLE